MTQKLNKQSENAAGRHRPSVTDRLRNYCHKFFPNLILSSHAKLFENTMRKRDQEKNQKTTPPPDEKIDFKCLWAVEFYLPSHTEQLISGLEKLHWGGDNNSRSTTDIIKWIKSTRNSAFGGGWLNLGYILRPDSKRYIGHIRRAPLPPSVDSAIGRIYSLTSSITCVVICFILKEEPSEQFNVVLKTEFATTQKAISKTGYKIIEPYFHKKTAIKDIRNNIRSEAKTWFRNFLPGFFSTDSVNGEFPTCELTTLLQQEPLPASRGERSTRLGWLELLGLDYDFRTWRSEHPELKLNWSTRLEEDQSSHCLISCRKDSISDEELKPYGGGKTSLVVYIDMLLNDLISRWAILTMLTSFERYLNSIRDTITFTPIKGGASLILLKKLSAHFSNSVNISIVSSELRRFASQPRRFDHECAAFNPTHPKYYGEDKATLCKTLREIIIERSKRLNNFDRTTRDLLAQFGTMISSHENIGLQGRIGKLTLVLVFLTIVLLALTLITALNLPLDWSAYRGYLSSLLHS